MAGFRVVRVVHLLLGEHVLTLPEDDQTVRQQLCQSLALGGVKSGDLVLVEMSAVLDSTRMRAALAGSDILSARSTSIWDIYRSEFGDLVLEACGSSITAHHTQARRFSIAADEFVQVAVYPAPPSADGVRMWCDPALVLIFTPPGAMTSLLEVIRPAQPMWERLRAHHGRPLLEAAPAGLAHAYPIESVFEPLGEQDWRKLRTAVRFLNSEAAIDEIVSRSSSPQRVVEETLLARRRIQHHEHRLISVLEHSHGRAADKLDALTDAFTSLERENSAAVIHLVAPHRHLLAGLNETRQDVERLASLASETAGLVASATVGRLLDRSKANQTAAATVAATLVLISIVTTFTSIASIPYERSRPSALLVLAGWIGAVGIVITLAIVGLRRTSAAQVPAWAVTRRPLVRAGIAVLVFLAFVGFVVGSATASGWLIIAAGLLSATVAYALAVVNDFS